MFLRVFAFNCGFLLGWVVPVFAAGQLRLVTPPVDHRTTSASIYFVGTAPPGGTLTVNGQPVPRSALGHFAWRLALAPGENAFTWSYARPGAPAETLVRRVSRLPGRTPVPTDRPFLTVVQPAVAAAMAADSVLCASAHGTPGGQMQMTVGEETFAMVELPPRVEPGDTGDLLGGTEPPPVAGLYGGCFTARPGWREQPVRVELRWRDQTLAQTAPGTVTTLGAGALTVVEVNAAEAIVRAGGGAEFARLTPLVRGVRARVVASNGEWLQLAGAGWVNRRDVRVLTNGTPVPRSAVRALRTRTNTGASELLIPLQVALPYSVRQEEGRLVLTVWGAESQTDIIRFESRDPVIRSVQWEPVGSGGVRYYVDLRANRQWGYQVRYEGTTLVLAVRRPPQVGRNLAGITVMLDPGHGGGQSGSLGPSGLPEKAVNLQIALKLRAALERAGAKVLLTRDRDTTLSLEARGKLMEQRQPTVFLSLHNNALPDGGDPLRQYGTSAYWYHPQGRALAETIHAQLVAELKQPDYGLYWDSLAVIRPTVAPAVLLELGFMTHPEEFARISNPAFQERLAGAVTRGLLRWLR
jgi:N-acetylmuramoyl-L-alanine amidase